MRNLMVGLIVYVNNTTAKTIMVILKPIVALILAAFDPKSLQLDLVLRAIPAVAPRRPDITSEPHLGSF